MRRSGEIEIHPILEKHFKNLAFAANPSFGRTLSPTGNSQGWTFNPALRTAYDVSKRLTLVEYYGQSARFPRAHSTVDVKVRDNIVWSLGVNVGPDSNDNHVIDTSRLQIVWDSENVTHLPYLLCLCAFESLCFSRC